MFKTASSHSKRRSYFRNNGLAFETTGSCSRQRVCIRKDGVVFETAGSRLKRRGCVRDNGGAFETTGVCSKRYVFETMGGRGSKRRAPLTVASTSKEGVGCEQACPGQIFIRRYRGGSLKTQVAASVGFILFHGKI